MSVRWIAALVPVLLILAGCTGQPIGHGPGTPATPRSAAAAAPFSVLNTTATVASAMTVAAGASVPVRVTGRDGIPASGVSMVAVHVAVREPARPGVHSEPSGTVSITPWTSPAPPRSTRTATLDAAAPHSAAPATAAPASLVAYHGAATTDGFALVGVGQLGALRVSNLGKGPASVTVDVQGFAVGSPAAGTTVVPLTAPDTVATGHEIGSGQRLSLPVRIPGLPASGVTGLLVNIAARASGGGQLRDDQSALLDYTPGATVSDLALLTDEGGRISLQNDSSRSVQLTATVTGYLSGRSAAAAGGRLVAVAPAALTAPSSPIAAGQTVSVPAAGLGGVPPAGADGVALGITATPRAAGARSGGGAPAPAAAAEVSVGVGGPGTAPAPAALCPAAAGACTGFAVTSLSSPSSGGAIQVHNYSAIPVTVSLASYGYLKAPTVPAAPTAVTASAAGGSAVLSWHAPAASGGAGIAGYTVAVSPGGRRVSVPAGTSRVTVPGIKPKTAYTFTVAARNGVGTGAAAVGRLVPAGTPGTPGPVTVRAAGRGRYLVSWTPAAASRARVTGYTVTAAPSRVRVTVSAARSSALISGLTSSAAYVPCVSATSSTGATAQACAGPLLVGAGGGLTEASAATSGSLYTPVSPVRVMDTRNGTGGVTGPVAAGKSVSLQVAGVDGVPSSGVSAVVMNVTVTQPTATSGVLTVYPD
ncbi:MAG TPA: fibronectin type III domain-containing protein, partial [Trebonia sp.]|nr:fibronectin type III domain-containing protein [Trebonia sp.]